MIFLNDRYRFSLNRNFADKICLTRPGYVLSRLYRNQLRSKKFLKLSNNDPGFLNETHETPFTG